MEAASAEHSIFMASVGEGILNDHFTRAIVSNLWAFPPATMYGMAYASYLLASTSQEVTHYREILDYMRDAANSPGVPRPHPAGICKPFTVEAVSVDVATAVSELR